MNLQGKVVFIGALAAGMLSAQTRWIGSWGAAPAPQLPDKGKMQAQKLQFENQTLREIVHVSAGSGTIRIRLSNAYGSDDVEVGSAHVALAGEKSAIVADSDRSITFGGKADIVIPPNA